MPISTIGSAGLNQASDVTLCTTSGNVGIGTASPAYKLDVTGTIRGRSDQYFGWVNGSQAGVWWAQTNYSVPSFQGLTSAGNVGNIVMQLGGANVGIGAASPAVKLEVQADLSANTEIARFSHSTGDTGRGAKISLGVSGYPMAQLEGFADSAGNGSLRFYTYTSTTTTEKMRLDSSGNLLVGTTSVYSAPKMAVAFTSAVNNGLVFYQTNNSTGTFINFFSNSTTQQGSIINNNNGTVNYANASDYRLKENIVDFDENGLNLINNVKVRKFNRKEYPDATITGFIAHELAEVCPQAVCGEKDAVNEDGSIKAQSVDQSYLVPFLVKAIQEMKAIIDTQASTITQLQADVAALKGASV